MPRDSEALTDEVKYFDEPSDETKRLVQLRIVEFVQREGLSHDEALELMSMCGVHPKQIESGESDEPVREPVKFV